MIGPATILVIDDVPENLAVVFDVLNQANFEVLVVESGAVALERMEVLRPDLILLDVRMPDLDGLEVCRRLHADPKTAAIPVIMMTALNDTTDTVAGFEAGAVDYLRKPVAPEEVLVRVNTHLQMRMLRKTLEQRNQALSREVRRRREAERQLEQSLEQAVLVVAGNGTVQFATRRAWDLLEQYFADWDGTGLPSDLGGWIGERAEPMIRFPRPKGSLVARLFTDPGNTSANCMVTLEEHLVMISPEPLQQLGLTPREAEVLYWLAQGKTSPEIAVILRTALNTVKKHAHNIYAKLGVDNRTAAAARAFEVIGPQGEQQSE
ncbi:MAG: response regulator [Puniceicoccaceae bacterium]|nr:MAG: response regulator [Puniceicoccaceae bacterium]